MGASAAIIGLSAASSFASSYAQANATKSQAAYEQSTYEANSRLSEIQAADAIKRGDAAAKGIKEQTKKLIGGQRAALAAQGQNLEADDALAIQEETAGLGTLDAFNTKNNAWREAWGFRNQAEQSRNKATFTGLAGKASARNTLLTGGLQAAKTISYGGYKSLKGSKLSKSDLDGLFE